MTREEAKKFIQDIANGMGSMTMEYWSEKTGDKLREALNVLEQEPAIDKIRAEIENTAYDWQEISQETVTEFADRCKECGARYGKLLKQKSDKWIPVSERLPEQYKEVIVTDIEISDTYVSRYIGNEYWECDNGLFKNRIIAWQPKPQPYNAESEVEE